MAYGVRVGVRGVLPASPGLSAHDGLPCVKAAFLGWAGGRGPQVARPFSRMLAAAGTGVGLYLSLCSVDGWMQICK